MVFQKKVAATKNKGKKAVQSPKPSMFKLDANDDDDDDASEDMDSDDFAESSDVEMDSDDAQEPTKTSSKKTPQAKTPSKQTPAKQTPGKQNVAKQTPGKQNVAKQTPGKQNVAKQTPGKQTPNKKNSVPDKKVSFELDSAKTPIATDSQVGKRQATPASKGKQGVQEFKGLKAGSKNKSQTSLKMAEDDDEDDDDDDEEDDDDDEDDDDEEEDDDDDCEEGDSKQNVLKSKLKQKIGKSQNEEEDDDDEEDDNEEDDEEDDDEEDDEEKEDDDSKHEVLKSKSKQKMESNQNSQQVNSKIPLKKEASSPTETADLKHNEKNLAIQQKNKEVEDLRNAKQLMIRNLPNDITCEEIKSLSEDIINVILPEPSFIKKRNFKTVFGFILFASEEIAEKNYAAFQNQKMRGVPIECDYSGVKSQNPKKVFPHTTYDAKKLHISGLPTDIKVTQIAQLTPSASSITLTPSTVNRVAYVIFDSEEAADEAFEANKEAKINGKPITVLYSAERNFGSFKPFQRGYRQGGQPPSAKRPRQDLDASSQD